MNNNSNERGVSLGGHPNFPKFSDRKQPQESRKIRRERESFQQVLMALVNTYITFKEEHKHNKKNALLIKNELKLQEARWKDFANKWNHNSKHSIQVRLDDFQNLIIYKENLERAEK